MKGHLKIGSAPARFGPVIAEADIDIDDRGYVEYFEMTAQSDLYPTWVMVTLENGTSIVRPITKKPRKGKTGLVLGGLDDVQEGWVIAIHNLKLDFPA